MLLAWVLTLPVCVLLGAALFGASLLFVFRVLGVYRRQAACGQSTRLTAQCANAIHTGVAARASLKGCDSTLAPPAHFVTG